MINQTQLKSFFKNKNIVVTGGLGSIGSAIISKLLSYNVKSIKCLDNRETELFYAQKKNNDSRLTYHFSDVKYKDSMRAIIKGADIVFHAAAMKHVLICEANPTEAINTNVIGTKNVMDLCMEQNVDKMILISTDKAINPEGVMGTTKLLAEKIISATNNLGTNQKTKFGAVRFGNVLYSRGSVLEIWDTQLRKGEKITIVNDSMSRFIMGIPQSVELILTAAYAAKNSEIFIMKMRSCTIKTLADAYLAIKKYPRNYFKVIGKVKGDKMHEQLLSQDETEFLLEDDKFFIKLPYDFTKAKSLNMAYYKNLGFKESIKTSFLSNDKEHMIDSTEVQKMIKKYIMEID